MFNLSQINLLFSDIAWAYVYIGCYVDDKDRDLQGFGPLVDQSNTLEKCDDICKPSFQYFAVQVF